MDIDIRDTLQKKDIEINCLQNLVKELQQKLNTAYLKPNSPTRKGPHPVEADIITKIAEEKAAVKNPEARSTNKKALTIGKQRPFKYQFKLLPSEDTVSLCSHRDTVKVKYVPECPYTCELCDKGFTHKGNLNKHMNDHKGLSNEVMTPQDYDEIRDNLMSNNAPINKPLQNSEVHSCEKCDSIFINKPALQEHNKIYHTEISQTKSNVQSCSHCEEGFNTSKCSYQTGNRDELVKHIYKAHRIQVQEKCTQCDKTFSTEIELSQHIKENHKSHKPCDYFKEDRCNLDEEECRFKHIKLKTGEHICFTCGKILI